MYLVWRTKRSVEHRIEIMLYKGVKCVYSSYFSTHIHVQLICMCKLHIPYFNTYLYFKRTNGVTSKNLSSTSILRVRDQRCQLGLPTPLVPTLHASILGRYCASGPWFTLLSTTPISCTLQSVEHTAQQWGNVLHWDGWGTQLFFSVQNTSEKATRVHQMTKVMATTNAYSVGWKFKKTKILLVQ